MLDCRERIYRFAVCQRVHRQRIQGRPGLWNAADFTAFHVPIKDIRWPVDQTAT